MANRSQRRAVKKKSPRSIPMSKQDVDRARKEGQNKSLDVSLAIILTALLDGGFLQPEQMKPAWEKINYLSDSIAQGYVSPGNLIHTLREDYGIYI